MNEGHGAGPQLVGQLTEDDPVGQSLGQVIRQRPLQLGLKHLAQLSHHLLFVQKLGGSPRSQDSVW